MADEVLTIEQAHAHAVEMHQQGRMAEAEALYRRILAVRPDHADTLHMLGLLAHQCGHSEQGAELIRQALAVNDSGSYWCNLAVALMSLGRMGEAEPACARAAVLAPTLSEPCVNMGTVLEKTDRPLEAVDWFVQAMARGGRTTELLVRQAAALVQGSRYVEALIRLDEAEVLGRCDGELCYQRGRALHELRRWDESIAAYRKALDFKPDHASALLNLGLVYQETKLIIEAEAMLKAALELAPGNYLVLFNLSRLYKLSGRITEAIETAQGAISGRPDFGLSHMLLGNAYHAGGRTKEALAAFRKALSLAPTESDIHDNVIAAMTCDAAVDGKTLLAEYRAWNDAHLAGIPRLSHANTPDPERRLRIGYLSPDFRNHACAYFLEPLLESSDRSAFEIFCYSVVEEEDEVTGRFKALADHWRDIRYVDDAAAAAMIQADCIDLLVDCVGHTVGKRMKVFARKPAPVQVATLIGHDGTTGIDAIDYVMGDPYLTPPGFESLFSETLVRLPQVIAPFRPRDDWPDVFPLPKGGDVVFGCFAEPSRIGDAALEMWSRILDRVPGSRLLLKHRAFGFPDQARYWRRRFEVLGERFDLEGVPGGWGSQMDVYSRVHVMLDTFPLTGATSSLIPLWMGVPVVSLAGNYPGRRYGATMLSNAGAPELVVEDADAYVDLAVALAQDRKSLSRYRRSARKTMKASPLLDAKAVTVAVEHAYRMMWRTWCATRKETSHGP
jgi:protein O-GlcNAc transferase